MEDINIGSGTMPQFDPRKYDTLKCSKCNSILWEQKLVIKKIPGMLVGQAGKDVMFPLNVLVCSKCGEIMEDDIKGYQLEKDLGIEKESSNSEPLKELLIT